jgi:hypothetical protein
MESAPCQLPRSKRQGSEDDRSTNASSGRWEVGGIMAGAGGVRKETRVGRYQVGRTIGHGTFAKVKLAVDSDTGDSVAMKVLDKDVVIRRHGMLSQVRTTTATLTAAFPIYRSVLIAASSRRVPWQPLSRPPWFQKRMSALTKLLGLLLSSRLLSLSLKTSPRDRRQKTSIGWPPIY